MMMASSSSVKPPWRMSGRR
uniref:Uncharacterized protein n=1 Tax=Arundo donax TaxID=35708 RepID=A0A0A9H8M9_ARUDO